MKLNYETERTFLQQIRSTSPSDDLVRVSEGGYHRLMELVDVVLNDELSSKAHIAPELQALADRAHKNMHLAPATTLRVWRILYTDSCILKALAILDALTASQSVGLLDRAIIVAGGGDENRLRLILSLINKIQRNFFPLQTLTGRLFNKKHIISLDPLFTAHCGVPAIDSTLSFLSFQNTHSKHPFVVRGYAKDWPALNEHSWNSIDYLLSVSGPSRVVPVEVGHDYRDDDWSQDLMSWESFLGAVGSTTHPSSKNGGKELYLAQYNLLRQFPSLRHDIFIPDYIYCDLTQDFPDYKPPENDEGVILNAWLGPEGAMSPAHFDPYHNFYVQIAGYKRVWLSPVEATPYMGVQSSHITSSANSSNTSHIDVFSGENVLKDFPDFSKNVIPQAMQVILSPGDLLFFPPGWWHGMRNESASLSISMWF